MLPHRSKCGHNVSPYKFSYNVIGQSLLPSITALENSNQQSYTPLQAKVV